MIKMDDKRKAIIGLWKFSDESVPVQELEKVANEWAENPKYLQLYVRSTSKNQHGIGFVYDFDGTKESQDKYFFETSDFLKRRFGNGLVGWDLSSTTQLIKGF